MAMSESSTFVARPLLREFEPLTNLLARVPRCIQKGVLMCDIAWTCVDVTDHWVVIGTDAGFVYVYSRHRETVVHQLTSQVATVSLLHFLCCLLIRVVWPVVKYQVPSVCH